MKIAILSDTHDNSPAVDWVIDDLQEREIDLVLHCGDLVSPFIGKQFLERFRGKMIFVWGNNDGEKVVWHQLAQENQDKLECLGNLGVFELAGKSFFMTHDSAVAEAVARSEGFDYCLGGHDHQQRVKEFGKAVESQQKTIFINPGNLTIKRKGEFYKSDDHCYCLLEVESGEVERVDVPRNNESYG